MKKNIYFVRHGQTDFNLNGIVQGSGINSSLNERGRKQANAFFEFYKDHPIDLIITSILQRTHQTVENFINKGIPWEQTPAINEINWGVFEGKSHDPGLHQAYKSLIKAWSNGHYNAKVEQGESIGEVIVRLKPFIENLKARREKNILVCTHGRTLRCLMVLLKKQPIWEMENYHHKNTCLYKVRYEANRFHVELENDWSHWNPNNMI